MHVDLETLSHFREFVWRFYAEHKRPFAWRNVADPYAIVVSEIMLQQTQTHRVEQKYEQFLVAFPSFETLARASLHNVLSVWQGLGYNRRGKYVHEIAQKVMHEYAGFLPAEPEVLATLPGIGKATAASICAFAFNKPTVFIETNIRAVFIHTFFKDKSDVHDNELLPLVAATVDRDNPREWYYALMDYGVFLKKCLPNPSRQSKHHVKQSKFEGSDRQIRGAIIRVLLAQRIVTRDTLLENIATELSSDHIRITKIVDQLVQEGLLCQHEGELTIA